jgi:hypothetical protein
MDSHFLSWDGPTVGSTIKIRKDNEFLSWDRPVPVKQVQANNGRDGVSKASSLSWNASTSESTRRGKSEGGNGIANAGANSNKLTGTINSIFEGIYSLAIYIMQTNSVM